MKPFASTSITGRPEISLTEKILPCAKLSVIENNSPELLENDSVPPFIILAVIVFCVFGLMNDMFDVTESVVPLPVKNTLPENVVLAVTVPPVFELLVLRYHVYVREPGAFVAAVTLNEVACTEGETQ